MWSAYVEERRQSIVRLVGWSAAGVLAAILLAFTAGRSVRWMLFIAIIVGVLAAIVLVYGLLIRRLSRRDPMAAFRDRHARNDSPASGHDSGVGWIGGDFGGGGGDSGGGS
jgi:uncharacterized membrane protein YgcG